MCVCVWLSHLYLSTSLYHGDGVVAPVFLCHTVLTDAAGVRTAEELQGPLVALAGPPLDVPQRIHQPVVAELWVLQVRAEVGLTVGHQAGEAGLEGPAGTLDAGVTHHIVGAQGLLLDLFLWGVFLLLICLDLFVLLIGLFGVLGLPQVLLDLGLLWCFGVWTLLLFTLDDSWSVMSHSILFGVLGQFRLVRGLCTLGASFGFIREAGAADRVRTGCRLAAIQRTWADSTERLCGGKRCVPCRCLCCYLCCCLCHVFSFTS